MIIDLPNAGADEVIAARSSITVWSRLEVDPCATSYDAALTAALADPLWMLARQWQFGEFAGEDAGTPVDARGTAQLWPFRQIKGQNSAPRAFERGVPLEAMVGAEEPELAGWDWNARAGHFFLQMAEELGVAAAFRGHRPFGLSEPTDRSGGLAILLARRSIDGGALAEAITEGHGVPAGIAIPEANLERIQKLCLDWLDWYRGSLPTELGDCRNPSGFGSAFTLVAGSTEAPMHLNCADHPGGRLDWDAFDIATDARVGFQASAPLGPVIPAPVRFAGMAADRFWEFEDERVNFGAVDAGPTDLGRLLVIEFALLSGNDWFVLPVTLPNDCVARIEEFTVRDSFGIETIIRPFTARHPAWRMFDLSQPGVGYGHLALPASVDGGLRGEPVEEIGLFRDEMANLAWAVEVRTLNDAGLPVDHPLPSTTEHSDGAGAGPRRVLAYQLTSPIPANWFPLTFTNELPAPRWFIAPVSDREARGVLLGVEGPADPRAGLDSSVIPATGIRVLRLPRFARSGDGKRLVWIGIRQNSGFRAPAMPFQCDSITDAEQSP